MNSEERLIAYLNVMSAYQPTVIPNKNAVGFISKKTGTPQAWIWNEESGVKQLTHFNDRVMAVYFSPDGEKVVISTDIGGNEKQQFYIMNSDGNELEELVVSPEHFHHFGSWSPDSKKISFTSNYRSPGFFDAFTLTVSTKEKQLIHNHNGMCKIDSWSQDGRNLFISFQETNIDTAIYLLDIDSGELKRIGRGKSKARYKSLKTVNGGKNGFVLTDEGRDTLALYKFAAESPDQMEEKVTSELWDLEEIAISKDEQKLLYMINEGGISRIHLYSIHENTSKVLGGLSDGVFESLSWLNDDQFIFCLKSATQPGDIWRYSISTNSVERLTWFGMSEHIETEWVEPSIHSYQSFDGLNVPYFYYGNSGENKPALIYVHGGPESQIRPIFNPLIQYLVSEGFNVATPNVRGSMGYGRKYVQLDDGRKRMDAVADLASLTEDLVKTKFINRDSIGIMGRSYGGFMVLAALTHYPDIWAAGVNIVGISHFKTFLENTGEWRRGLRECEYGTLEHDTDFFEEIAPLNHSKKITAPLLIIHGRNDTRVPVTEAEQMYSDMKSQGQEVDLIIFENEGHQTEKIENHITLNRETASFMKEHLRFK